MLPKKPIPLRNGEGEMAGTDLVAGHAELWYLEKPGLKSTKNGGKNWQLQSGRRFYIINLHFCKGHKRYS